MALENLGYNKSLEQYRIDQNIESLKVGRVISEHKERYIVKADTSEFDAEIIGNLRFTAENRYDFPAVGDWVAFSEYDDNKALIHSVYPRTSIIERRAAGKSGESQIIATNIDYGLIVQSVNRDFNINRLERYLTICNTSNVEPIIVISKTDLIKEKTLETILTQIKQRIKNVILIAISNQSGVGLDKVKAIIKKGKTYCLLGSSGVGKSTLLNRLAGKEMMATSAISKSIDRGKHVTTHRELIVLKSGGILIDNPGLREIGITNISTGLETTFDEIVEFSQNCKFNDCTHINEKGCAVIEALENGEIDTDSYANYHKMKRERDFFESSLAEKKKKDKDFGKMIKNVKKQRKQNKY